VRLYALILAVLLGAGYETEAAAQNRAVPSRRVIFGTIDSISGSRLVIRTRTGSQVRVDALDAMAGGNTAVLFAGRAVRVLGTVDAAGVLHAETILRERDSPALWEPDH
jgi:hypothetical protein